MQEYDWNLFYKHMRAEIYHNFSSRFLGKIKYDDLFWKTYYWLDETNSWNIKQFREYQMQELRKQIEHAYYHTIYYRKLFDENGWKPKDFQNFRDFRKIPILSKDDMKEHFEELRALPRRNCYVVTTGGTTGIPTKIYQEIDRTVNLYRAFVWQWYNEGKYYPGDKAAILRGSIIRNGCYGFEENSNELHCSSMKMSEKNMRIYLLQMEKYGIKAICALPSAAELLAKYVKNTNTPFNGEGKIKSLFTSSETLTDEARRLIEEQLHLRVYDLYGNSEQMGMIGQLRDGQYHEYMCHSYVEYLDESGSAVKSGKGRIVATGFINRAMPLLRYDTNDFAEVADRRQMKGCSAQVVVKNICGRWKKDALIIGKNGNRVNISAINTHANLFDHIYKMQFVQEKQGKIKLNIMPNKKFSCTDLNNISQEFKNRLGETFELEVCITDQFEYTDRGKERLLVQKLKFVD